METDGCNDRERDSTESNRRSGSPEQHEFRQELAEIATEVTVRGTSEPTVSSVISSGLQTIHGTPAKQPSHAWVETCEVDQHGQSDGEASNVPSHCDQISPQLEPYPMPVVSELGK